jgi:D-alanyl-D-alanine carboxypeptidase (penicillin-binding protein 5/6)
MYRILGVFTFICLTLLTPLAYALETPAHEAILIDADTHTVLFEKNSQEHMPTSSMSKTMTLYVIFQALKDGHLKLDQTLPVSEEAWKTQGSKMFVPIHGQIKVEDLIRGVAIQSGNDATIVLAEGLSGSETAFVDAMNEQAKKLGMKNSHFMNADGWPEENHYSTAYDLALLAYHLIKDFPQDYHYFSEKEFVFNNIKQGNRNPLLYRNIGADGVKTGHTDVAGYGLIGSAIQNGRRLVLVVNGLSSMQERADESARLLTWGFQNFKQAQLFKTGEQVEVAKVWMGQKMTVPVVVNEDVKAIYNINEKDKLVASAVINEPIQAPVKKGTEVGQLKIKMGDFPERVVKLYAGEDVPELGLFQRMIERAKLMVGMSE